MDQRIPKTPRPPVFIVGNSRSGTTMLTHIFRRSPELYVFRELHFFERLWAPGDDRGGISEADAVNALARLIVTQRWGIANAPTAREFHGDARTMLAGFDAVDRTAPALFAAFVRAYAEAKKPGSIPCDQTPRNVLYIPEILDIFPDARIVNLVRDPRDVLVSQKNKWKRSSYGRYAMSRREALRLAGNYHPVTMSRLWRAAVRAGDAAAGHPGVRTLRFEDLLADPAAEVRAIFDFIGAEYSDDVLNIPRAGSSSLPDQPEAVGIDADRAHAWRRHGGINSAEIAICQRICRVEMQRHGYALQPTVPNPLWLAGYAVAFPIKLAFALIGNRGRARSLRDAIRRRL